MADQVVLKKLQKDVGSGRLVDGVMLVDSTGAEVDPSAPVIAASEAHIGEVGGKSAIVSANVTRPADTTAYASGDLVANNTTSTSVVPMSFAIGRGASGSALTGMLRRMRLRKTGNSITNAQFRLHLWKTNIGVQAAITVTIATPGVVTWTGHGLSTGSAVQFTTTGALPTGITAGTTYYAIKVNANTFQLASSATNAYAGTAITTSGTQSGVHTGYQCTPVGDNGVFVPTNSANYVGKYDVTMDQAFSDGASGNATPAIGSDITFAVGTYYGLLEARAAYTPVSGEVFTCELEVIQN